MKQLFMCFVFRLLLKLFIKLLSSDHNKANCLTRQMAPNGVPSLIYVSRYLITSIFLMTSVYTWKVV